MQLTFEFCEHGDFDALGEFQSVSFSVDLPDQCLHLIGVEERILKVAEMVGTFTQAALRVTCTPLKLRHHVIKASPEKPEDAIQILKLRIMILLFERGLRRPSTRRLKILVPITEIVDPRFMMSFGRAKTLKRALISPSMDMRLGQTDAQRQHLENVKTLSEQLLVLLNAEPHQDNWQYLGFNPSWMDNSLVKRFNTIIKKQTAVQKKREKAEQKRAAKGDDAPQSQHGTGRRFGAIPGVFMGVQFRSQLEIRFAAELEERGVRWVYEPERLGDGNYLVDFYLPDDAAWVEVKGQFEARDHFLLKEVAQMLKQERSEKLYVYTSSKVYLVHASNFREMSRADFWKQLKL